MERTTDINKIKEGAPYSWGQVIEIYEIGEYTIIASRPWSTSGCTVLVGHPDPTEISFHGWVNKRDTCCSWDTLDKASTAGQTFTS